ncbi:sugar isomerase [Piscirickettsia salmonis]|uniref:Glutamine--fructose-6-phosphate aminotransferase [isomerizing] n=1 Tax=Piscirickettsia salmonis TaxID=1238 RepID=A0A9Q6PUK6_PISSA|nr:SIS domain-containing protein [Piscirickettsia salmonis]RNC77635.1 SIS domain-containing protein [Piscirickettsiaceae bacterium NZ-RLO2]ALA25765.1 SIS domain protein [Piscirickettsia salmonis]APS43250.1 sugar isomerase [Piscirickettsia salmonis]APS46598.1 sugar isomerase [Piscirickettsia salmonis]APS50575.1 sugar isomerase [Piscirickettsia salmonis]
MTTFMAKETRYTPLCIESQLKENNTLWQEIAATIKKRQPQFAMTIGRGSSDHACTFAKYLLETQYNLVTASAAPSTRTLYQANLQLKHALVVAISQSGQSADLCEMMAHAKKQGATTIAIVNQTASPLADLAEFVIPIHAGEEKSVAATKSYIGALAALLQLTSTLSPHIDLPLSALPEYLRLALDSDWSQSLPIFKDAKTTLIVGRGYQFPIAQEAALKCKETAMLHAEAFSGAEVLHGPFALVQNNYPVLSFIHKDASQQQMVDLIQRIQHTGAQPITATAGNLSHLDQLKTHSKEVILLPHSLHPLLDPLITIQSFYVFIEQLARLRGFNPDEPLNLSKVTSTK